MIGSSLMFVALTQCAASVYQMMRGSIVVITAAMAVVFLGRKQYAHHVISLIMIVVAVAIVGLAGVANSSKNGNESKSGSETTVFGVLLLLLSQCFTGIHFIT
jgi:drug/metabolite transporter (DMT)-like permease